MNKAKHSLSFHGKVVIVTGGTRGIGKAIVDLYLSLGAKVIITGRSESTIIEPAQKNPTYFTLDCSDQKSVVRFVDFISKMSRLDVLVNNAGINKINSIADIAIEDFDNIYAVNLKSPFLLCQAAASVMKKSGGKILNIASIWSKVTRAGRISYISSKSGLAGMTRGLATDLAPFNILVNTLSPGFVGTDLTYASLTEKEISQLCENIPLGRLAKPEEIASHVIFLTSDMNTYLTGRNIVVDGGFTNV